MSSSHVEIVDENNLRHLFQTQKEYVDHFFQNIDITSCNTVTNHIIDCKGWVLISGVGKSGSIANVFSDFLVSMGIRSRFLSPVNALHGDIGIVCQDDVFVFISKSGETEELKQILPFIKNRKAFTISLICNKNSTLARASDLGMELPLMKELCPFGMAPVTSSILQMIFSTTIAIACMKKTQLSRENYAKNHPGGAIGRRLCLQAKDVMTSDFPRCSGNTLLEDAFGAMSLCGAVVLVDDSMKLLGLFTDGDLRRSLKNKPIISSTPTSSTPTSSTPTNNNNNNETGSSPSGSSYDILMRTPISSLIKRSPITASQNDMARDILQLMQSKKIHQMVVVDDNQVVVGIILERELVKLGL
jgi:arabinose-5-phosphate isomerase